MAVSIHPHKGYLNTLFHVYTSGINPVEYHIIKNINGTPSEICKGTIHPNEPYSLEINIPGQLLVEFSDGTTIPLTVEDGYKYGGSTLKEAYIFDDCPWLFIVMHDRTYFYNRDTQENYVEAIAPDEISVISKNYVIFGNKDHSEQTIYSLDKQTPILCVNNIIFNNDSVIVWQEEYNENKFIIVYSLSDQKEIHRTAVELYAIDSKNNQLIFSSNGRVETITLTGCFEHKINKNSFPGEIINLVTPNLAISYQSNAYGNFLYVYDVYKNVLIKKIEVKGELAKIGENKLIDVWQRQQSLNNFDITATEFTNSCIAVDYYEFTFYSCDWEIFYIEKYINLKKNKSHKVERNEEYSLHSCINEIKQPIQGELDNLFIYKDSICLYNNNESFILNKNSLRPIFKSTGTIYKDNGFIYLYDDDIIYTFHPNGSWRNGFKHKYDFKYYEDYNIIINEDRGIIQSIGGYKYGRYKKTLYRKNGLIIVTNEAFIFPGRKILKNRGKDLLFPDYLSESLKYGLTIGEEGVTFFNFDVHEYVKLEILKDIFDSSKYRDVLLSENGKSIMYRNGTNTIVKNLVDDTEDLYDNLSYVKHINGIRPLFGISSSLQPRLINPVTKQPINFKTMTEYKFVSPDGTLYADTRLKEYIEYYWLTDNTPITKKEYINLEIKYSYPSNVKHDSKDWQNIKQLRTEFIYEHFDFLNENYPELFSEDRTGKKWKKIVLDENNSIGVGGFLGRLIGKKGIAYIRNFIDNSEVAKIELGEPLNYINYVSFSYDSNYMALAGYRGNRESSWGGLLLIYDLIKKKTITFQNTQRAVWLTAFSKQNALASYTSNPFTFFAKDEKEFNYEEFNSKLIDKRSFLTFSPDGVYFAVSKQGYVSKYDRFGNINQGWGHQPSSLVEIRLTSDKDNTIVKFNDLSNAGIADVATSKESVASVSFSNDNKKLMMVGKDGVVIVRNLHLDEDATE